MTEVSYKIIDGVLVENSVEDLAAIEECKTEMASDAVEELKIYNRQKRNALLAESDWTQANDSPLAAEKKVEWASYRTALRDLPTSEGWPSVTFPTEPS